MNAWRVSLGFLIASAHSRREKMKPAATSAAVSGLVGWLLMALENPFLDDDKRRPAIV